MKLEEQKKNNGMMQTSLEQKDGRMNEMQRKIEVKVKCPHHKVLFVLQHGSNSWVFV